MFVETALYLLSDANDLLYFVAEDLWWLWLLLGLAALVLVAGAIAALCYSRCHHNRKCTCKHLLRCCCCAGFNQKTELEKKEHTLSELQGMPSTPTSLVPSTEPPQEASVVSVVVSVEPPPAQSSAASQETPTLTPTLPADDLRLDSNTKIVIEPPAPPAAVPQAASELHAESKMEGTQAQELQSASHEQGKEVSDLEPDAMVVVETQSHPPTEEAPTDRCIIL